MRWEELERRLREVSRDRVEASLYYHGPLDEPWLFEMSSLDGRGMVARPMRFEDVHSLDRGQMVQLRDFLNELLPKEVAGA